MSEWRDIWKQAVKTSQNAILSGKVEEEFSKLRNTVDENNFKPYQDDKMVDFEEGIAYECIGNYDKAIEIYERSASPKGLHVNHWKYRAGLCLERAKRKKRGECFSDVFGENYLSLNSSDKKTHEIIQWDAFYEIHSFVHIPSHIRYLAISSISRIDSEPEMAIVIFRTCLEDIIRILYPNEYQENEEQRNSLGPLLHNLFKSKKLFTIENNNDFKKDYCKIIKDRGDDAAHGNEITYSPSYISDTIIKFIEILKKADKEIAEL
ncbi:protein of unknown function [Treponema bryantii]|uniref:Uncharacterized protein n=1 Tax=Treponema bryantii TaxID=163 RepID=A0A1I3LR91_9SPIR|nr:DUF4145 domain-containing protein [Treponema bryantii]SFI86986.1 protein of unknown function [Treponema bryantii]